MTMYGYRLYYNYRQPIQAISYLDDDDVDDDDVVRCRDDFDFVFDCLIVIWVGLLSVYSTSYRMCTYIVYKSQNCNSKDLITYER